MEPGTVGHTAAAFCSLSGCIMLVCYVCVCSQASKCSPRTMWSSQAATAVAAAAIEAAYIYCKYTEAASAVAASMRLCS